MTGADPTAATHPAPAYPMPCPDSGDDPRLGLSLVVDISAVLQEHGFPPVHTWPDYLHVKKALFRLIYQEKRP